MLVSMVETMGKAREEGYCVPALTAQNEHCLHAVLDAAEEANSPVILLQMYNATPDFQAYGQIARILGEKAKVPVSIILDHGAEFDHAIAAIRAGFTDIMIDRSSLPYQENVAQVSELVKIAHAVGVGVEAELGHVGEGLAGGDSGEGSGDSVFTDPDQAAQYVEQTGIDTLAVSIGTAHGAYKGVPKLQFELLEKLRETVPVPLVLHGGSGSGDDNLRRACSMGICKLNMAFDLYRGALDALAATDLSVGSAAYGLYPVMASGIKKAALHCIDLCGSANKA